MKFFKIFITKDHGVSSIEYALISFLIAVVIIGAVTTVGTAVFQLYLNIANKTVQATR